MFDYKALLSEIRKVYISDRMPWIIGYSGGKDSTVVLQMVFYALSGLSKTKLSKEIHVVSSDTLVENPAIIEHLKKQLKNIEKFGRQELFKHKPNLFNVALVKPKLEDTFWVNLIGKGYPSPNRWFRWCTERMKINPTSNYILDMVGKHGKVVILLGTRKAESANRASSMNNYKGTGLLRKHKLPKAFVYAPIADLSNNEVWAYLLQCPNQWDGSNKTLLGRYKNACSGGECPFVIETGTQSCGKSRFGCWVCTVVDRDKSMEHFVQNGHKWMEELLYFRNWLYNIRKQTHQYVPNCLKSGGVKFGPFLLKTRYEILKKLLKMQKDLPIELINSDEVEHIKNLLREESKGRIEQGMRRFIFRLPSRKRIAVISDFNSLLTPRKRIGPLFLKEAKLIASQNVTQNYLKSKRVMYYEVHSGQSKTRG